MHFPNGPPMPLELERLLSDSNNQASIQSDLPSLTNRLIDAIAGFHRPHNLHPQLIETLRRDPTDVDYNLSMLRAYTPAFYHFAVEQLLCAHAATLVSDPLHLLAMWGPKLPTAAKDLPALRWAPYDEDRQKVASVYGVDALPIVPLTAAVKARMEAMLRAGGRTLTDLRDAPSLYPSPLGPAVEFPNLLADLQRASSWDKAVREPAAAKLAKYVERLIYLHRTSARRTPTRAAKDAPAKGSHPTEKEPSTTQAILAHKLRTILGRIPDATFRKHFHAICTHAANMSSCRQIGVTKAGNPRYTPDFMRLALAIVTERAEKAGVRRSIDVNRTFMSSYAVTSTKNYDIDAQLRVFIDQA